MNKIEQIAKEVARVVRLSLLPDRLGCEEYFIAAHQAFAEATYAGRDEKFLAQRFREKMVLASAWCWLAADADSSMVLPERIRQDKLWGDEFDSKNTYNDWHAYVAHYMSLAMRSDYVANMIKAACICQAAVLIVDRYGSVPRVTTRTCRIHAQSVDPIKLMMARRPLVPQCRGSKLTCESKTSKS